MGTVRDTSGSGHLSRSGGGVGELGHQEVGPGRGQKGKRLGCYERS